MQQRKKEVVLVSGNYLLQKNVKQFETFFTGEVLTDIFLIEAFQSHENIYDFFITVQANQIEVKQSLETAGPVLVEADNELLKAHLPLFQKHHLRSVYNFWLILAVLV